jgi:hypothetical protein
VADCWADQLKAELSQGDLLSSVLVGTAANPKAELTRGQPLAKGPTRRGGGNSWDESAWKPDGNGLAFYLARGRDINVVVLSEDCEIDKDSGTAPVLVAPVFPISVIQDEAAREVVRLRQRYPFLPLPKLEGVIAESYVDLRCITYIDRKLIAATPRIASMTQAGKDELVKQIIAFFTHIPVDKLVVSDK